MGGGGGGEEEEGGCCVDDVDDDDEEATGWKALEAGLRLLPGEAEDPLREAGGEGWGLVTMW